MGKAIFRRIGGRIVRLSPKRIADGIDRTNALKAVRKFIEKSNSGILIKNKGYDVSHGLPIGDSFVKKFKGGVEQVNIEKLDRRLAVHTFLYQKGMGPKTFHVKTSKSIYSAQEKVTGSMKGWISKIDRLRARYSLPKGTKEQLAHLKNGYITTPSIEIKINRIMKKSERRFNIIDKKMDMAKVHFREMYAKGVRLEDVHGSNWGFRKGKVSIFDAGHSRFNDSAMKYKYMGRSKKYKIGF